MDASNWKVLGVVTMFPVAVKLHNSESGATVSVPALYNPTTNDVRLLHGYDVMGITDEVSQAVRSYFDKSQVAPVQNPVAPEILDEIKVLKTLIKKPDLPTRE